jgi:hypothetical protein
VVDVLTLKQGPVYSAVSDSQGDFAYIGAGTPYIQTGAPGTTSYPVIIPGVSKVRLSDLTEVAYSPFNRNLLLHVGLGYVYAAVIDEANDFAYFGTDTNPGVVVKVRLSDLSVIGYLTFQPGEGGIRTAVIDTANGFAYFGINVNPGILVKVRLSDFTEVASLTTSLENIQSSVIDSTRGFAYFSDGVSIVRVQLSDFTENGAISEGGAIAAAIDPQAGYAYFGDRVRLADFTLDGALPQFNIGVGSAVIDPVRGYAYFGSIGTSNGQGEIIQVRLDNLSIGDVLHFPYSDFWSAVIDPAGGFAYFINGNVLKINISVPPVTTVSPSSFDIVLVSSVIAFPLMVVSILAVKVKRPKSYPIRSLPEAHRVPAWGSILAITSGGMLLVASLWQLEITEISASLNRPWCAPFLLGCLDWFVARDFWFTGILVSFGLALVGAVTYSNNTRRESQTADRYGTLPNVTQTNFDDRVYSYIIRQSGTISLAGAAQHFGVPVTEINASIERLKRAGRIT